jgi:hypothetical protein
LTVAASAEESGGRSEDAKAEAGKAAECCGRVAAMPTDLDGTRERATAPECCNRAEAAGRCEGRKNGERGKAGDATSAAEQDFALEAERITD